jgi:hypothetical protein
MANITWVTPAGNLGIIPENEYYEIPLEATNPSAGDLTYLHLSGDLPPGIQVDRSGFLRGVPVVTDNDRINNTYQFSVRARNQFGKVADRTFSLTLTNIVPPVLFPRERYLGDVFDGEYFSQQLTALEVNPGATLVWKITNGELPPGVTFNTSTGLLSGFIYPLPVEGSAGLSGYEETRYNQYAYDNSSQYRNKSYTFTVTVYDGANYDTRTYTVNVTAKIAWSADATINLVNDGYLTIDTTTSYSPIMTTLPQELPEIRSGSNFAFKFEAIDPENDDITFAVTTQTGSNFDVTGVGFDSVKFDQSGYSLPPGLGIDPDTGWLTGFVPVQPEVSVTYTFEVYCYKTFRPEFASDKIRYTVNVLGDVENTITWYTPSNLGTIDNGSVSELAISAISDLGKRLEFSLSPDAPRLPQGLVLQPDGLITGRPTFEYFSIDSGATTIDRESTTFDISYTFTVIAKDFEETVIDSKDFTVSINNYNVMPYENLYITALPSLDQRRLFQRIVNNTDIFPEELIYRSTDPWFGRAKNIRSLFLAGLNPTLARDYIGAMQNNHFNKSIEFGTVKTAKALDSNFNVKYEVVYLELIDTVTQNASTPASQVDLTGLINPWQDSQGNEYSVVYPNAFGNMTAAVAGQLGYSHEGVLPDWMTSPQENNKPLGFVNAVVLAYTVPGASKLISYRLSTQGLKFNDIDFVIDRYQLDNHLSTNYDISINSFIVTPETTWDRIIRIGTISHSVNYAVRNLPFDNINGQTVGYVRGLGGIDGDLNFQNGDTLIFYQQENYSPVNNPFIVVNANDGWNYTDGTVVPGFTEKDRGVSPINYRAGVWRIKISTPAGTVVPTQASDFGNDLVGFDNRVYDFSVDWVNPGPFPNQVITLEFVEEVIPSEQVQVVGGTSLPQTVVFYDPTLKVGLSVPEYSLVSNQTGLISQRTKFDNNGTKFFSNRDSYSVPEQNNKYLKFPKYGVFK